MTDMEHDDGGPGKEVPVSIVIINHNKKEVARLTESLT